MTTEASSSSTTVTPSHDLLYMYRCTRHIPHASTSSASNGRVVLEQDLCCEWLNNGGGSRHTLNVFQLLYSCLGVEIYLIKLKAMVSYCPSPSLSLSPSPVDPPLLWTDRTLLPSSKPLVLAAWLSTHHIRGWLLPYLCISYHNMSHYHSVRHFTTPRCCSSSYVPLLTAWGSHVSTPHSTAWRGQMTT